MSGLVTMTPSSVDAVGGTTTINANGGVDFENISELALNNVFTSEFDNYKIVMSFVDTNNAGFSMRLRREIGGSMEDDLTNSYVYQDMHADGGVTAERPPVGNRWVTGVGSQTAVGHEIHMYGPFLPQPTANRSINVMGSASGSPGSASIYEFAGTHSLGNSYSGLTLFPNSGSWVTGNIIVMGYAE